MFKNNPKLLIIALIALVNSLGYGIIIPILDSYTERFGLNNLQYALLFAVFSLCQFLATPLIGRLSDKYGRRPLLLTSLFGTALSFFMMAFAPNAIVLFIARALDGITAGNIPVAYAVISDTTDVKDRTKGFSIIGASFGFGFIFGPAVSALTVGYGAAVPFIIAGVISTISVVITALFLPETNKHKGEVQKGKLFDFSKMFGSLRDENVGSTFLITLIYFLAFGMLITTFQPFAKDILNLTPTGIGFLFTIFGIVGLVMQLGLLHRLTKRFGIKRVYRTMFAFMVVSYIGFFFTKSLPVYIFFSLFLGLANSAINPLTLTILSQETDEKSQGSMQGINASFAAMGNIFGPIIAGLLSTYVSIASPFLAASILCFGCFLLSFHVLKPHMRKESAF